MFAAGANGAGAGTPPRPPSTGNSNAAPTPATVPAKVFEIAIRDGKVGVPANRIVVAQGSPVELRWTSDRPIALHLHGYDIETRVAPDAPATMAFNARIAGRFPLSEHRHGASHHRALMYLEVHP